MKRFLFVVGVLVAVAVGLVVYGALQRDPAARQAAHGLGVIGRPLARGFHLAVDPAVTATSGNSGAALIGGLIVFAAGMLLFSSLRSSRAVILAWLAVSTAVGLVLYLPSTAHAVKHTWTAAPVVVTAVR